MSFWSRKKVIGSEYGQKFKISSFLYRQKRPRKGVLWENKTLWERIFGVDKDIDDEAGEAKILRVFGELWKIGKVKGEGVRSGYRTKGPITWAGLARFAKISAP